MAQHKTKDEYIEQSLKAIKEYNLFFVTDIPTYLGISVARFYQLELEKVEEIKQALEVNRVNTKVALRKRWWESDNPTLQILLFKLIATNEERKRTSTNYVDVTSKDKEIKSTNIFATMTNDELAKFGKELEHVLKYDGEAEEATDTSKTD